MEFMKSWITNITIVIIFIMLLDMLMPNNGMKRFIKVIMGLLIILVIVKPFLTLKNFEYQFQSTMAQAEAYIESSNKDNKTNLQAFQNNTALDIYKQKLSEKVTEIVKSHDELENREVQVNIDINNDINSADFGSIKAINVIVENGKGSALQTTSIEPVKINKENVINKTKSEYKWNNSKLSQDLKSDINEALGLNETDIAVEIQE